MWDLVGNPDCRFSHAMAHLIFVLTGSKRLRHYPWSTFHLGRPGEQMPGVCREPRSYHGLHQTTSHEFTVLYVEPGCKKYLDLQLKSLRLPHAGNLFIYFCIKFIKVKGDLLSTVLLKYPESIGSSLPGPKCVTELLSNNLINQSIAYLKEEGKIIEGSNMILSFINSRSVFRELLNTEGQPMVFNIS